MTTICSNCYDVGHMRVSCKNQRANYLDYVTMLMNTGKFDREMFGNWASRADKYQAFKQAEKESRQKQRNMNSIKTIEEESYIEMDDRSETGQVREDDDHSNSSYKSTETIIDDGNEKNEKGNSTPKKVKEKISSFESRTSKRK